MTDKRKSDSKRASGTKKRRTITLEEKLDIVKRYERGQSLTFIKNVLGMASSTVNTILKDKERIIEYSKGSAPMKSTVITKQRSGLIYEMEKLLILWIEDQNQRHMPLSFTIIQEKAKSIYENLKIKTGEADGGFIASHGWFNRFKRRANLQNMKMNCEPASVDKEAANKATNDFHKMLGDIIRDGGYLPEQVFNVDETGLFWKKMPERTYIAKEEKTIPGFKAAKDRLSLLLGGNSTGECKLKPLLVYHVESPRALKGIDKASLPVTWMSSPKAWVTLPIFEAWFRSHLIPQLMEYCQAKKIPFKILLILNNAPGHPTYLDDFYPNIKVVYMPPNITSLLQPMNQEVIAAFKAYYLRKTFTQAIQAAECEDGKTLREFWKDYNIYDAVKNIAASWEDVKSTNMNYVWKKLCPQFEQVFIKEEIEDTVDEVTNDVIELARQLKLELETDDVEMLLKSHTEELSNEDLMELEAQKAEEEGKNFDDGTDVESLKRFTTKGLTEVFKLFDKGLACLEKMDPDDFRFDRFKWNLQNNLTCYKAIYDEKKTINQISLDKSIKKIESPTQPSTSLVLKEEPVTSSPSSVSSCSSDNN